MFETDEAETARLFLSPATSINGRLAQLPVTIKPPPRRGMIVELPWRRTEDEERNHDRRAIVLLSQFHSRAHEGAAPYPRNGSWDVIVVASIHPSYPVGGYDLCVSESEVRRSQLIEPGYLLSTGAC